MPESTMNLPLPKSCMGFVLKTGETFFIHEEDVKNITGQIIVEGSLKKGVAIIKETDRSLQKADMLYNILKQEKDMKPDLRNKYLRQISELLGNGEKKLINCSDEGAEVKIVEDPTAETYVKEFKS